MCAGKKGGERVRWEEHQEDEFEHSSTNDGGIVNDDNRLAIIRKIVGSGKKVLEVAANDGWFGKILQGQGNEVTCFELPKVAAVGKKKNPSLNWVVGSAEDPLSFVDGLFDVVVASEIIEHLLNLDGFLDECHRILRPGGQMIVSTPNVVRPFNVYQMVMGASVTGFFHDERKPMHIRFYTIHSLLRLLGRHDFVNSQVAGANTGNDGYPREATMIEEDRNILTGLMRKYRQNRVELASVLIVVCEKKK